jgi:hypothetical protein
MVRRDLKDVLAVWNMLPAHIRQTINTIVNAAAVSNPAQD